MTLPPLHREKEIIIKVFSRNKLLSAEQMQMCEFYKEHLVVHFVWKKMF